MSRVVATRNPNRSIYVVGKSQKYEIVMGQGSRIPELSSLRMVSPDRSGVG
jgi:hypothetical protein